MSDRLQPASAEEVAAILAAGGRVRPVGGATKLDWGGAAAGPQTEVFTAGLDALVEHNEGDLTVVVQAGMPLTRLQSLLLKKGQRLSLDPPDHQGRATVGGILATGDSGPLRHRFGGPRDLVLGVRVALPDGTVARAGSKVIKNVAGYDLAKLMCGALGSLGVICEATLRLHPRPVTSVTAIGSALDPGALARCARELARHPLELEALDLRWDGAQRGGAVLARAAGQTAPQTARQAATVIEGQGIQCELLEADEEVWARQRARQRAPAGGAVVRVSGLPTQIETLLAAVPAAVMRAGLGLAWAQIAPEPQALAELRAGLAPSPCVLLGAPAELRAAVDPWGLTEGPELELMRRVKRRFDPQGVCSPGCYVGGL